MSYFNFVRPTNIGIEFCLKKNFQDWLDDRSSLIRSNRVKWVVTTYGLRSPQNDSLSQDGLKISQQEKLQIQLAISTTHFRSLFLITIDSRKTQLKARPSCKIQPEYTHQSKQEKPQRALWIQLPQKSPHLNLIEHI